MNYFSPLYVVYTGNEPVVSGGGYYEYGVVRSDYYAWGSMENKTIWAAEDRDDWVANANGENTGHAYVIANAPENDAEWKTWRDLNKSKEGTDYMVSAKIEKSALVLYVNANGIEFATAFKVDTSKPVYLSLTGENCTLSDIKQAKDYYDFSSKTPAKVKEFVEKSETLVIPPEDENTDNCYSGNAWWISSNTTKTKDQIINAENDTVKWYVGYYENIKNVTGIFSAELMLEASDGKKYYISTSSDMTAWYAEAANVDTNKAITCKSGSSRAAELGHKYEVTATRKGQTFTITYFDLTTNSLYAEFVAEDTNFPVGDVGFHLYAQFGKYKFDKQMFDIMPEVVDNNPPLASYPLYTPTPTASADGKEDGETLECGSFWSGAFTNGTEITSDGIAIKFKNTTTGSENFHTPILVGYSGSEPKVEGTGYKEHIVIRSDAWAWVKDTALVGDSTAAAWEAAGYTFTRNPASDWASWLAANKEGVDCLVQAIRVGNKVYVQIENNGVKSIASYNVSADEKCYISLTGEQCKLTGIKATNYTGIDGVTAEPNATVSPSPSATPDASASPEPGATTDPNGTTAPGNNDNNTPGNNNTPGGDTPQTPGTEEPKEDDEKDTKKTMKVSNIKAKKNTKKVTGTVSVKGAKVKVKIGKKAYKNAKVSGKKFTFTASSKLKKGTKVTIKITKSGYKTITKTVKVK